MAFKMTPGMKGNPSGVKVIKTKFCGGAGQPPCEPLFEKEKQEEKQLMMMDRKAYDKKYSGNKAFDNYIKAKVEKVVAPVKEAPVKEGPVKEVPVVEAPVKTPVVEGPVKTPVKGKK